MAMKHAVVLAAVAAVAGWAAGGGPAGAQGRRGLHVVAHLAGYECLALAMSEAAMRDFDDLPPVLSEPRRDAERIGIASASVIAASPPKPVNGFVRVLHLNGREGWVEARKLRPWRNANSPGTRCVPARMSDGGLGFDYVESR